MFKMKLVVGLAALMTALVVMTASAMAVEFESNGSTNQGKVTAFPEKSSFVSSPGNPAIECKNGLGQPWAEWSLQSKKSSHELLQVKKWGNCTGPTGLPASVKCNLEVNSGGTGSVPASGCSVLVGNEAGNHCTVKVASAGNKELAEVKLEASGTNGIAIESNVGGITSTFEETPKGECTSTLGIKAGSEGTFKTEGTKKKLITEGQKLV
jgi:hypothetical protein